ncbi:MAG TPA: B12-binding domain-containing radical SAM protein [Smithellaceae bacterium]|nr:B12-binding domain-containing radical SAM protein [Smithellaceae bacterium]
MNILLIFPKYPDSFWSFTHTLKYVSKKAVFPPIGLLTVAALLPKDWSIRLADLNIKELPVRDTIDADYVLISATNIQIESTNEILKECHRLQKKVIAGGPLFANKLDEYINIVDHLVLDEGEVTIPRFLADLAAGNAHKVYRADKNEYALLQNTPIPRWDLINIKHYASLMIQHSRGCPFGCEFCDVPLLFGNIPRIKSDEQIIRELEAVYDTGWRGTVFIIADNFVGNRKSARSLLPKMAAWMKDRQYPFTFFTELSINLADDDEIIQLIVNAGFDNVFIGLETPNEESLQTVAKNHNCHRDMVAAIKKLQAAGLQVCGGFIVGFDRDDESIFARQIKFIQESGVVAAMIGILNVMPNTRLWQRLAEEGRLLDKFQVDNTDGGINYIPVMDKDALACGYRDMLTTLYSPRVFYQRVSEFLKSYHPAPIVRKEKHILENTKVLLKSIFYLGILGNGASQWFYWKMMIKSLIFYPRSFYAAIQFMIYGEHFRKVANDMAVREKEYGKPRRH